MMRARSFLSPSRLYVLLVLLSAVFTLLRAGPLNGTLPALLLTGLFQLVLPGLLLARAFGKLAEPHPITRFTWIMASGLGLTICLGGAFRWLQIPIEIYLLVLHGLMLALALRPLVPGKKAAMKFAPEGKARLAPTENTLFVPTRRATLLANSFYPYPHGDGGREQKADPFPLPNALGRGLGGGVWGSPTASRARFPLAIAMERGSGGEVWRLTRANLPLYLLLALCCVLVSVVGWERNHYRFSGYEDQTVFVAAADWLAHDPDEPLIPSRRVSDHLPDTRNYTDGWTYNHAAWVWVSGVPAAELIWYVLTPLFGWMAPLAVFALAYETTRSERVAAWSAAALVLTGLLLLETLVYTPHLLAFGQNALFQLNTPRTFSTALMLPLALLAVLAYLNAPRRRDLALIWLVGMALASLHARQMMIFLVSAGATLGLWFLARPSRQRLFQAGALALALVSLMALPYLQLLNRPGSQVVTQMVLEGAGSYKLFRFITVAVPLLGQTRIADPAVIFYHPLIGLAAGLGLALGLAWRRNLAALHAFAATTAVLLLLFLPGLAAFYTRIVTAEAVWFTIFALPIPLILGLSLEIARLGLAAISRRLFHVKVPSPKKVVGTWGRHVPTKTFGNLLKPTVEENSPTTPPPSPPHRNGEGSEGRGSQQSASFRQLADNALAWNIPAGLSTFFAACLAVLMLVLLVEPFPIPASARDRINAANQMQMGRDIHPADQALIAALQRRLPTDRRSVILSPTTRANYLVESVPKTLITGGRRSRNEAAFVATARFFTEAPPYAPWLDSADLNFIQQYGVTHIIIRADATRLAQMLLQPERFELLDTVVGYHIFRVLPGIQPDETDALFEQMNTIYSPMNHPRWSPEGFDLAQPGDVQNWQPVVAEWTRQLAADPENERARLGLAFSQLLLGADADAQPLWQQLYEAHAEVALYAAALAHTGAVLGRPQPEATLLAALDSLDAISRVLAARMLLTETFFPALDADRLQKIVAVTEAEPLLWQEFALLDQPDALRQRAALLMNAGFWATAERWLNQLEPLVMTPQDVQTLAALALVQGDVSRALALLRETTDPDWYAARAFWGPDRWANNVAAQDYDLLRGELAYRAGQWNEAQAAYESAINRGAVIAGNYFLARTLDASGQTERAAQVRADLESRWAAEHDEPLPELVSLLALADSGAIYAMQPQIERPDETTLRVSATYGDLSPYHAYPVQSWRLRVMPPASGEMYAEVEVPARLVDGALVRVPVEIQLPDAIPPLTPAVLSIQPRHNRAVTATPLLVSLTLNRPDSAVIPASAVTVGYHFGDSITLAAYTAEQRAAGLDLTLYWQTAAPLAEDYQVFIHVFDADGKKITQVDAAPVNNRYPTSQWRTGVLIADPYTLPFDIPAEGYTIRVGLYRLPDGARLPITPADSRSANDSLLLVTVP